MSKRLAHIRNGIVAQVSEGAEDDLQHAAWLNAVASQFDAIIDVTRHRADNGYAVNVGDFYSEFDGFRPPSPYFSWEWTGTAWVAPIAKPEGQPWDWDEASGAWVRPDGYVAS